MDRMILLLQYLNDYHESQNRGRTNLHRNPARPTPASGVDYRPHQLRSGSASQLEAEIDSVELT